VSSLRELLRGHADRRRFPGLLVLAGRTLFVALHAVSDIGITGLLRAYSTATRDNSTMIGDKRVGFLPVS
jgi:hypothetical protein